MDQQLQLELVSATDEAMPNRTGSFTRSKKYTFYLGQYGPFVERVPLENFDPLEFQRRVTTLRAHLLQAQQG